MDNAAEPGIPAQPFGTRVAAEPQRMFIARSLRRKIIATLVIVSGFVVFYEATIFDSRFSTHQLMRVAPVPAASADPVIKQAPKQPAVPNTNLPRALENLAPAPALRFSTTAYCKGTTTASGVIPRTGIAAADPDLLPVGSVIQVGALGSRYNGVYTVMDTGPKVIGRNLDLYLWSCDEAIKFGRRATTVVVLRLGWNPRDTEPTLFERLLDWSGAKPARPATKPGVAGITTPN